MARQSTAELAKQLATLKAKSSQLEAKATNLENRLREQEKKEETRRKILIGAWVLDELEKFGSATLSNKEELQVKLETFLTRKSDRALFGLTEKSETKEVEVCEV